MIKLIDIINNGGNNVELTLYREKYTNGNSNASITTTNIDNTIEVSLKEYFISFIKEKFGCFF